MIVKWHSTWTVGRLRLINFLANTHFEVKQMLLIGGGDTAEKINLRDRCISEQEVR